MPDLQKLFFNISDIGGIFSVFLKKTGFLALIFHFNNVHLSVFWTDDIRLFPKELIASPIGRLKKTNKYEGT